MSGVSPFELSVAALTVLAVALAVALVRRARLRRSDDLLQAPFEPDELQELILSTLAHYFPRSVPLDLLHRMVIAARPDLPGNLGGEDRTRAELERLRAERLVFRDRRGSDRFGLTERGVLALRRAPRSGA